MTPALVPVAVPVRESKKFVGAGSPGAITLVAIGPSVVGGPSNVMGLLAVGLFQIVIGA